jgi:hypothetical protein
MLVILLALTLLMEVLKVFLEIFIKVREVLKLGPKKTCTIAIETVDLERNGIDSQRNLKESGRSSKQGRRNKIKKIKAK